MLQAMYAVTISCPVDAVFAFVADGEKGPQWHPGITDITRVSGDAVGARYAQGVSGPLGRRIAADYEITVFLPNRRLEFQTIAGPARPHGRYDFEAVAGGTRLTFSLDAQLRGLRQLLMGSAVQKTMDAEVRTLDILKRVLEIWLPGGPASIRSSSAGQ
jgi:carbon monoxide dehydrogenase subunit G